MRQEPISRKFRRLFYDASVRFTSLARSITRASAQADADHFLSISVAYDRFRADPSAHVPRRMQIEAVLPTIATPRSPTSSACAVFKMVGMISDPPNAQELKLDDVAAILNAGIADNADTIKSFQRVLDIEIQGAADVHADMLANIIHKMNPAAGERALAKESAE
ncbi:hypothetical protein [Rhizobium sp. BK376]|uniref:hypothetical protein n=1 Tax=Rhizobium sp. BK376 TaxID=2512149 RepID=UPI001052BB2A|nr:hypothetical protein [Rhizobium sp. BK376]TCR73204.1 hypothetical protein EV561_12612 [Rhizobium sp. BK376]